MSRSLRGSVCVIRCGFTTLDLEVLFTQLRRSVITWGKIQHVAGNLFLLLGVCIFVDEELNKEKNRREN